MDHAIGLTPTAAQYGPLHAGCTLDTTGQMLRYMHEETTDRHRFLDHGIRSSSSASSSYMLATVVCFLALDMGGMGV